MRKRERGIKTYNAVLVGGRRKVFSDYKGGTEEIHRR